MEKLMQNNHGYKLVGDICSNSLSWTWNDAATRLWRDLQRYGGFPAATGNQDAASCYRSPMTLLIPSWLSPRSAPHIPPINRTACQLILPSWLFSLLPSILHWAPNTLSFRLDTLAPYTPHFTDPLPSCYMTLEALNPSFMQSFHLSSTTHQSYHTWLLTHTLDSASQ